MCGAQLYYSPAFLRKSSDNLFAALRVLASVYRASRSMFPFSDAESTKGALVYLDQLSARGPADSLYSDNSAEARWILVQNGDFEAVVQHHSLIVDGQICVPPARYGVLNLNASLLLTLPGPAVSTFTGMSRTAASPLATITHDSHRGPSAAGWTCRRPDESADEPLPSRGGGVRAVSFVAKLRRQNARTRIQSTE